MSEVNNLHRNYVKDHTFQHSSVQLGCYAAQVVVENLDGTTQEIWMLFLLAPCRKVRRGSCKYYMHIILHLILKQLAQIITCITTSSILRDQAVLKSGENDQTWQI